MTGKTRIACAARMLTVLQGCTALGAPSAVSGESLIPRADTAIWSPSREFRCTQPRGQALLKRATAHCGAPMSGTSPRLV
jgi:hypothetical protein